MQEETPEADARQYFQNDWRSQVSSSDDWRSEAQIWSIEYCIRNAAVNLTDNEVDQVYQLCKLVYGALGPARDFRLLKKRIAETKLLEAMLELRRAEQVVEDIVVGNTKTSLRIYCTYCGRGAHGDDARRRVDCGKMRNTNPCSCYDRRPRTAKRQRSPAPGADRSAVQISGTQSSVIPLTAS